MPLPIGKICWNGLTNGLETGILARQISPDRRLQNRPNDVATDGSAAYRAGAWKRRRVTSSSVCILKSSIP